MMVAAVLGLVSLAGDGQGTAPDELRALLPPSLLALVAAAANIGVLVLAAVVAVERLIRRAGRDVVRGLAAAAFSYGAAEAVNAAVLALSGPAGPPEALSAGAHTGLLGGPAHAYLAAAMAYTGAVGRVRLARVRGALWAGIAVTAAAVLLAGVATVPALALTALLGATGAALAGFAVGAARPESLTGPMVEELRRFGLEPLTLAPAGTDGEGNRRFTADTPARRLDLVLMRADDTAQALRRLGGMVLLRGPVAPPVRLGLARRLEHAAVMGWAAREAGACAPDVLGIGDLGAGSAVLIREYAPVRTLDEVPDEELTDAALEGVWRELALLQRNRIAHGAIDGDTVGWRTGGRPAFTGLSGGAVAAAPLKTSLDTAALLTVLALRTGAERSVRAAVAVLGLEAVAAALPLLQPAGMPHGLRRRLRDHPGVLGELRSRITGLAPEAPARPARLERMRPRTVVSVGAATVVGLVLANQLAGVDLTTVTAADAGWAAAAFAAATSCMLAAALALMGFVPIRLNLWTTVLVQYAGSFIRIAAPAGLGSLAINTRYITCRGASAGLAISAVGLSQAVGLLTHVPLLLISAYLTGTGTNRFTDFSPSPTLVGVVLVLAAGVAAVLLVPRLRGLVMERVRPYFQGVVPQLLDLLQRPRRLAMGVGGTLMLTAGFVLSLYFSVLAFGGQADLAAVAVVFLAGNAVGSAAPTPGGLGAVEAALLTGLSTVAGLPVAVGLPAVLLFRVLTFWFPVLPGWGAFHLLQKWKAI
ncbi:lysylphosphatidylglycerol synthase transmembrane domain-containing protein [Nocardiopsis sp. RSe5-2]|uniref:Lysylphosphatidylglycerol synthase transmembrane domain-containing protein n=1 Tax=Nocardiopsis endophytica TaxID=3018445 RepID=A0ABT4U7Y7_9ACTN|nr:lysylphosphatidylglycerol synthase transmembrane domain-containing protein [Nocardiopsis endophytica]MDA2812841.1 lysylphosphatidylglycerol synthase transmembrane domain-containing protein [Nocardiopsis endophytica]